MAKRTAVRRSEAEEGNRKARCRPTKGRDMAAQSRMGSERKYTQKLVEREEWMDPNEALWKSLREKGHRVKVYVVDRMMVLVDGVEMTFDDAKALDRGWVTLEDIAQRRAPTR
jgi:hypothetical protein